MVVVRLSRPGPPGNTGPPLGIPQTLILENGPEEKGLRRLLAVSSGLEMGEGKRDGKLWVMVPDVRKQMYLIVLLWALDSYVVLCCVVWKTCMCAV
jgi:hypothetical protein